MECLWGYTFPVMTSATLSGGVKTKTSMECLGGRQFFVTSGILSGGMNMRDEHGMLGGIHFLS